MQYTVALVGNPNCGKTTLFNHLTGANQRVGNWPGVTVEKKEGKLQTKNARYHIVDLPGIYSFHTLTKEERVAKDFVQNGRVDIIINIVDALNLERGLYLTLQLLELSACPVILAINMIDEAKKRKVKIDTEKLAAQLGICVVAISARNGKTAELKSSLFAPEKLKNNHNLSYTKYDDLEKQADARYRYIENILQIAVDKSNMQQSRITPLIDRMVLSKLFSIPIFLLIMAGVFAITFGSFGNWLKGYIEYATDILANQCYIVGSAINAPLWVQNMFSNALVRPIGSIACFLPQIMLLFLCLSFLEDVGYMSRVSFIMDAPLRKIGLQGRSFVPLIMGLGCTTTAIMATRTMDNELDRRLTMIVLPFVSCGARLPIYLLFAGTFFPKHSGLVIFSIYLLGIIVAVISAMLLRPNIKGDALEGSYLNEFPEYRLPTLRDVFLKMWQRCKDFIVKSFTIIFSVSVLIWFMQNYSFTWHAVENIYDSMLGKIAEFFIPALQPLGFGTIQAAIALFAGLAAKEAVISTFSILFAQSAQLGGCLQAIFTPLSAYSFMVFCLLYMPCIAAFSAMKRELHSLKWTAFAVVYQTMAAYFMSYVIYQIGRAILCGF